MFFLIGSGVSNAGATFIQLSSWGGAEVNIEPVVDALQEHHRMSDALVRKWNMTFADFIRHGFFLSPFSPGTTLLSLR